MDTDLYGATLNQLITALKEASDDSTRMANKIMRLTYAIIGVGILQAAATWFHR